jgi:hypothetical protein
MELSKIINTYGYWSLIGNLEIKARIKILYLQKIEIDSKNYLKAEIF